MPDPCLEKGREGIIIPLSRKDGTRLFFIRNTERIVEFESDGGVIIERHLEDV
jgi:hypothetical protein